MVSRLTATQAKTVAYTDLIVHNEIDTITRQIMTAGLAGAYTIIVSNGTLMTDSTPIVTIVGTVASPTIITNSTIMIAGVTITLGTTGTNLNAVIADINDANVTGLTASKDATNHLVLEFVSLETNWSVSVGAGTANTALGFANITTVATPPVSVNYYSTWSGLDKDRKRAYNMAEVMTHFQSLGFNILQKVNSNTTNTLEWQIFW